MDDTFDYSDAQDDARSELEYYMQLLHGDDWRERVAGMCPVCEGSGCEDCLMTMRL